MSVHRTLIDCCEVDSCSGGCVARPACRGRQPAPARGSRLASLSEQRESLLSELGVESYGQLALLLSTGRTLGLAPERVLRYRTAELAGDVRTVGPGPEDGDGQLAALRNEILRLGRDIALRPAAAKRWGPLLAEFAAAIDRTLGSGRQ